jgi:Na+-translocating ferredoxin:NAD+ oxidoreductase RnfA subunit
MNWIFLKVFSLNSLIFVKYLYLCSVYGTYSEIEKALSAGAF